MRWNVTPWWRTDFVSMANTLQTTSLHLERNQLPELQQDTHFQWLLEHQRCSSLGQRAERETRSCWTESMWWRGQKNLRNLNGVTEGAETGASAGGRARARAAVVRTNDHFIQTFCIRHLFTVYLKSVNHSNPSCWISLNDWKKSQSYIDELINTAIYN